MGGATGSESYKETAPDSEAEAVERRRLPDLAATHHTGATRQAPVGPPTGRYQHPDRQGRQHHCPQARSQAALQLEEAPVAGSSVAGYRCQAWRRRV